MVSGRESGSVDEFGLQRGEETLGDGIGLIASLAERQTGALRASTPWWTTPARALRAVMAMARSSVTSSFLGGRPSLSRRCGGRTGLTASAPNLRWTVDITYVLTDEARLHFALVPGAADQVGGGSGSPVLAGSEARPVRRWTWSAQPGV